jgi:hypothetical protein
LNGEFEKLKERTIGIELFGREPSYDTGEDSIVRVTATDVRKRLFEYYARPGSGSPLRIELPAGSYIPEITQVSPAQTAHAPTETPVSVPPVSAPSRSWNWLAAGLALAALGLATWFGLENRRLARGVWPDGQELIHRQPWVVLLDSSHRTNLVTSDTNVAAIQDLTGQRVRLADYANRRYAPNLEGLSPDVARAVTLLSRNQFTAAADVAIAVRVSALSPGHADSLQVKSAKNLQLRDFRTDDNFILIGSSRANPWAELVEERTALVVDYDDSLKRQVCLNRKPTAPEAARYVPTAVTGGTGEAFAVVAFVQNPGQKGHILLIAGTNMEATEAAGQFVTTPEQLDRLYSRLPAMTGGIVEWESLLRVPSMAGASKAPEILIARRLQK